MSETSYAIPQIESFDDLADHECQLVDIIFAKYDPELQKLPGTNFVPDPIRAIVLAVGKGYGEFNYARGINGQYDGDPFLDEGGRDYPEVRDEPDTVIIARQDILSGLILPFAEGRRSFYRDAIAAEPETRRALAALKLELEEDNIDTSIIDSWPE